MTPAEEKSRAQRCAEGLTICAKYSDHVAAYHDEIYAGTDEIAGEDAAALEALGWREDEQAECWRIYI